MSLLLSLPNELLRRIIEETMPEGFEAFVCSCKAVYAVSRPYLDEHNTLRRQYRHFSYGITGEARGLEGHSGCGSSLQLLARIAEDPRIAR